MANSSKLNSIVCCRYFKRPKSVKTEQDVLTNHSSQFNITEEELKHKKLYGVCKTCGTSLSDKAWCRTCEGQKLQKSFSEWTSGNEYVDDFIRNSQTKPLNKECYLSWIPFENLSQVKYMANGGFSAVYRALWDKLENSYLTDVVLKRLHNGCTSDPEFLKEQTIENWVLSSDKPICNKLSPESKGLVKQLKDSDILAKKQFKIQADAPILLPPPPTISASVFTSKSLKPFVTASDCQTIRKISSSTSSLIHVS
ncbi:26885_t:CDS:2 [Dentiscutata erythropus]|uniref:26885_t:CDS:1 n=1 Tax=Dentiscutata erythropus TaxID=1348616 RepID=A0A9N9BUR1_9GLOM|nr:26885_t:CDS:2 [Dentiscutata erythropus]